MNVLTLGVPAMLHWAFVLQIPSSLLNAEQNSVHTLTPFRPSTRLIFLANLFSPFSDFSIFTKSQLWSLHQNKCKTEKLHRMNTSYWLFTSIQWRLRHSLIPELVITPRHGQKGLVRSTLLFLNTFRTSSQEAPVPTILYCSPTYVCSQSSADQKALISYSAQLSSSQ